MTGIDAMMERLGHRLAEREDLAQIATVPDYPFIGPDLEDSPTVSFVGKANGRWPPKTEPTFCSEPVEGSEKSYLDYLELGHGVEEILSESKRVGKKFRTEEVADYYAGRRKSQLSSESEPGYYSRWWTFVVTMAMGLLDDRRERPRYKEAEEAEVDGALRAIHTTNLFKVSKVGGNPTDGLPSFQVEHGAGELLRSEFEEVEPDLIIFPIGHSYYESRTKMLKGWETIEEADIEGGTLKEVTWKGLQGSAFKTRHPQGASNAYLDQVYRWIHHRFE